MRFILRALLCTVLIVASDRVSSAAAATTFGIYAVPGTLTLTRGDVNGVYIWVDRSGGFQGNVSLTVENLPPGVTLSSPTFQIGLGQDNAKIDLHAAANAQQGTYLIKVVGRPSSGISSTYWFRLVIVRRTN
jgi:hypothetical protein